MGKVYALFCKRASCSESAYYYYLMEQRRRPDEKLTCSQQLVWFQNPLAICCIVKGTSVSGDGVYAQVRMQLCHWLVFEDLAAARRVLECNTCLPLEPSPSRIQLRWPWSCLRELEHTSSRHL